MRNRKNVTVLKKPYFIELTSSEFTSDLYSIFCINVLSRGSFYLQVVTIANKIFFNNNSFTFIMSHLQCFILLINSIEFFVFIQSINLLKRTNPFG